jgi:Spy/CpxP family protein refolding chaperone
MDLFAQNKLLLRIVILLAVLNAMSIGILLWKELSRRPNQVPPVSRERSSVTSALQHELNLSADQVDQFKRLRAGYSEKEEAVRQAIRNERDSMNVAMFNRYTDEAGVLALARRIADNEYEMELLRFKQSQELKSLCTPEQLEKFERLVIEMRDYFRPEKDPSGERSKPSGDQQTRQRPPRSDEDRSKQRPPRPDDDRSRKRPPRPDDDRPRQQQPRPDDAGK